MIPHTPPPNPDEHLRHDQNRRQEAERNATSGRSQGRHHGLSTGDKIIFLVLGIVLLAGTWFFLSWLLG